jgi:hypothetical protein
MSADRIPVHRRRLLGASLSSTIVGIIGEIRIPGSLQNATSSVGLLQSQLPRAHSHRCWPTERRNAAPLSVQRPTAPWEASCCRPPAPANSGSAHSSLPRSPDAGHTCHNALRHTGRLFEDRRRRLPPQRDLPQSRRFRTIMFHDCLSFPLGYSVCAFLRLEGPRVSGFLGCRMPDRLPSIPPPLPEWNTPLSFVNPSDHTLGFHDSSIQVPPNLFSGIL